MLEHLDILYREVNELGIKLDEEDVQDPSIEIGDSNTMDA